MLRANGTTRIPEPAGWRQANGRELPAWRHVLENIIQYYSCPFCEFVLAPGVVIASLLPEWSPRPTSVLSPCSFSCYCKMYGYRIVNDVGLASLLSFAEGSAKYKLDNGATIATFSAAFLLFVGPPTANNVRCVGETSTNFVNRTWEPLGKPEGRGGMRLCMSVSSYNFFLCWMTLKLWRWSTRCGQNKELFILRISVSGHDFQRYNHLYCCR